jgi:hypothetical protein
MLISRVRKLKPWDRLLYWVREREAVRLKKAAGQPPPWTDDDILRTYRFCNVRRMDDRVSRWLLDNYYERGTYAVADPRRAVVAAVLARCFNHTGTLKAIQPSVYNNDVPNWLSVMKIVRDLKAGGGTVFNSAYMLRCDAGIDKITYVVDRVARPLWDYPPTIYTSSIEKSINALLPRYSFSTFMAGQVVADLRWVLDGTWVDRYDYAPAGPGSARGAARLFYAADEWQNCVAGILKDPAHFAQLLGEVRRLCLLKLPPEITDRLEAIDYQNCLCEYDRYERTLWGQGRPKRRYP